MEKPPRRWILLSATAVMGLAGDAAARVMRFVGGGSHAITPPSPPVITSTLATVGTVGSGFGYAIEATNSPTSYGATGLPGGLGVDTSSGIISGTPTATGTTNIGLSASNAGGTGTATLVLTVSAGTPLAPVITSSLSAGGTVGSGFSYTITATNGPASFNATGLPGGLGVDTGSGVISGTPTSAGTTSIGLSATNAGGTGSATLVLTVVSTLSPPVITSSSTAGGAVGTTLSYSITATNSPTSYNATGLPAGLSINTATGLISGIPTTAATSSIGLSAANAAGTGSATLVLTVESASDAIPITDYHQITGPGTYRLTADTTGDFNIIHSNVTLLGDGHNVKYLAVGVTLSYTATGIVVQDLTCEYCAVYGNSATTETALSVHLNNITAITPLGAGITSPMNTHGSNILIENCHIFGNSEIDDTILIDNSGLHETIRYVTINNCVCGTCWDTNIEGVGDLDHCTFTNNDCSVSPFSGIGAWYGINWPSDGSISSHITNCTFINNKVHQRYMFTNNGGGSLLEAHTDAEANANWGAFGNSFTGTIFV
jgi:hypothetical protein